MKRLTDEELEELDRQNEHGEVVPRQIDTLLAEVRELRKRVKAAGKCLSDNGCDCDCGHDPAHDDHEEDCEPCLACRVADALEGVVSR